MPMGRMLSAGDAPASTWNVANLITIARICLVPAFLWLMSGATPIDAAASRWWAGGLFMFAIATDAVDGHLARSRNLITNLGKLLDPIADKALTGSAFVALSVLGELPWWVTAVVLIRELGITLWRLVEARRRVLPAGRGGKAKTVSQAVALGVALLPLHALTGMAAWHVLCTVTMSIAVFLTVASGVDYLWQAYRPSVHQSARPLGAPEAVGKGVAPVRNHALAPAEGAAADRPAASAATAKAPRHVTAEGGGDDARGA